jgi:hypothetical protein
LGHGVVADDWILLIRLRDNAAALADLNEEFWRAPGDDRTLFIGLVDMVARIAIDAGADRPPIALLSGGTL